MLYIFWKIIGLCPFRLTKRGTIRMSYGGAFYSAVLSVWFTVTYLRAMNDRANFVKPGKSPMSEISDFICDTSTYSMVVIMWLTLGFRQKHIQDIQKSFRSIVETCEILGIREVHVRMVKVLKIQVTIMNTLAISFFLLGHLSAPSVQFRLDIWMPFNGTKLVYPNFILLLITLMTVIRDQFRSINHKIQQLSRENKTILKIRDINRRKKYWQQSRQVKNY